MLADQRGLKISTIESVHTVLHQVLTTAVEDNYLGVIRQITFLEN